MKISNLLVMSYICYVLLGCTSIHTVRPANHTQNTTQTTPTTQKIQQKKNPLEVSFYPNGQTLNTPYKVIGEAKVSKYNTGGIKRQDAIIHDTMRSVAASMGGDAIIDIKHTHKSVIGKVITYQSKIAV